MRPERATPKEAEASKTKQNKKITFQMWPNFGTVIVI